MNQPVPDELISAYFDGEVTSDERRQVEELLESSPDLRLVLDDTAKLSALLHSFPRESAPAGLAEQIQKEVAAIKVNTIPVTVSKKPSLRREWTAFGAGMLVTMATLVAYVGFGEPFHLLVNRQAELGKSVLSTPQKSEISFDQTVTLQEKRSDSVVDGLSHSTVLSATPASSKPATVSLGSSNGAMMADGANNFFEHQESLEYRPGNSDAAAIEVADTQSFLLNLKNGDVVYPQLADPSNTVAVGEFTVVDTERGAEGIKLLLQKRDVQEIEETELGRSAERLSESTSSRKMSEQKQKLDDQPSEQQTERNKHEDLIAIFVRAKGDRLEGAIRESLKSHPDLYQKFEAQLPIGLPEIAAADSSKDLSRDSESDAKQLESLSRGTASVSTEANLAVNSYAKNNGLSANTLTHLGDEENIGRRNRESKKSSEGFTTFRVAVDAQKQPAAQQEAAKQNFGMTNKWAMAANNPMGNSANQLQNSMANQGLSSRAKGMRYVADQRDSRLVRMLIVLKPAAINPATTP